ncbi:MULTISPECIES: porin [unclassified Comamonas]|uniref:porin n=1 Tax=unclassified Comamonas TaxID=2638500 RepID=UPI001FA6C7CD|nr:MULTISPECIES: porin [unclassified Comamonas]UNV88538.1 porin [Comamonas sp. 7D-2evo1]UNV93559.1 porin [Comamonas sp. 7D-2]UNV98181.1 porin [Comamonas sp. 7D-2evo2]
MSIALAALASLGIYTPAQADSLSISGIVDAGLRHDWGASTGSSTRLDSGQMIASRFTLAGEEALGNGLKAGFVLEAGFSPDTGSGHANPPGAPASSLTFGRTSAVSLGSDTAGYISMGRQYTPLWSVTGSPSSDPFGAAWLGGVNTLFSTTVRASNSIAYTYGYGPRALLRAAPAQGLGLAAMYSAAEADGAAASQSGQQLGFNASYGSGPFWLGYGFHQIRGSNLNISATAAVTDIPVIRQQTLVASYQWGNTRLHAGVNTGKSNAPGNTALHRKNWHIGLTSSLSPQHTVRALFGRSNDASSASSSFSTFQIGYQYNLSKRSMLYTAYGHIDNNSRSSKAFAASSGTYLAGATPKSWIAGMRHNF